MDPAADRPSRMRYLIAPWFAIVGYLAGGMIGVFVAKVVGGFRGCAPPEGFPACDFERYLGVGSAVGLVLLPSAIVWQLWRSGVARPNSNRG